jgi:hypothetical protein
MKRFLWVSACALPLLITACTSTVTPGDSGGGGGAGEGGGGGGGTTSSSGAACDDPEGPAAFEVGSGEKCFERLTEGQVVTVLQGPQGGYHLWLALGCGDCDETAIVRYGIKDVTTKDYFTGTPPQKSVTGLDNDGWHQHAGFTDFLPGVVYDPTTQLPKGTHVILSGAILDTGDKVLHEQEIEVELGDVEIYSPPCSSDPGCGAPGGLPCCTKEL